MSDNVHELKPNRPSKEDTEKVIDALMKQHSILDTYKGDYMKKCQGPRQKLKDILDDAEQKGHFKKGLQQAVKNRRWKEKNESREALAKKFGADELVDEFIHIGEQLGLFNSELGTEGDRYTPHRGADNAGDGDFTDNTDEVAEG